MKALETLCINSIISVADFGVVRRNIDVVVVAPTDVEFEEECVSLDPSRFPGIFVPNDARGPILKLVDLVCAIENAKRITVTGFCNGALVAAYAAVCARACVACKRDSTPDITSVTFGIPVGVRVPSDTGRHYVHTLHTACMHPGSFDTSHITWIGERDSLFYVNRVLSFFVRPVHSESLRAYADALTREPCVDPLDMEADAPEVAPDVVMVVHDEWELEDGFMHGF
jgi:hypothetical protein